MQVRHVAVTGLVALLVACNSSGDGDSAAKAKARDKSPEQTTTLPTAPENQRVDLDKPTFDDPTDVTNPLFPIGNLQSAVLLGNVDGVQLRVETTLLPYTETIDVDGEKVETLVSQYVAYIDGRIEEVAIDWYAQADDGAVWYLGEDVKDYVDGVVDATDESWRAGEGKGEPFMIMPAHPKVGDVYRPENIPGVVFEEVTVKAVDVTVAGANGPVPGAMVGEELHMDGGRERKTFAPDRGEFASGVAGSVEDLAVASPADQLTGPQPAQLTALAKPPDDVCTAARDGDWPAVASRVAEAKAAWAAYQRAEDVPPLLSAELTRALVRLDGDALTPAATGHNATGTCQGAIDVGIATSDLRLRHEPVTEVDRARFQLWARQLTLDLTRDEPGLVAGDVATLELVRDRLTKALDDAQRTAIDKQLRALRHAADDEDMAKATKPAQELATLAGQL